MTTAPPPTDREAALPTPATPGDFAEIMVTDSGTGPPPAQALEPSGTRRPLPFFPEDANDMWRLSAQLAKASLVPDALKGKANDVFFVLMTGREMHLTPMQSLHGLHVIHGKVFAAAQLLIGLVHRSGQCEFFRCEQSDDKSARYRTRRKGWGCACACTNVEWPLEKRGGQCAVCEQPIILRTQALSFTLEQARAYELTEKRGSNYKTKPAVMLRWRAASQLARDVYPEATLGMYVVEEADDFESPAESLLDPGTGIAGLKAALEGGAK